MADRGPLDFSSGFKGLVRWISSRALFMGAGNSTYPWDMGSSADKDFMSFYAEDSATSGDARGLYMRLYISGAGGGGESLRAYTTVNDVAAATAHGAHLSLGLGTSGSLTGQGIAARCTLHMPSTALGASNVTYAAVQAEIYSDAATSDPSGNLLSAIRVLNDGNATGKADVDDDCAMIELTGWTSATGNMVYGSTVRCRVAGSAKYLVFSTAENSLTLPAPLVIGVDDTGQDVTFYGATASSYLQWDESDDALELHGVARLDLSGCTVKAANTDGGVIKAGASGAPVTEDTADMKFVSFYFDNGATSGDNRGIYNRFYLTGAGGGGESLRSYTTVSNVAATTAHGAHLSLSFGTSGSITGLGVASRCTLEPAAGAMTGGTYAPVQSEIYHAASASMAGVTDLSMFRVCLDGNATAIGLSDHKASLFTFAGNSIDTDHMIQAKSSAAVTHVIRIVVGSTPYYLMVSDAV